MYPNTHTECILFLLACPPPAEKAYARFHPRPPLPLALSGHPPVWLSGTTLRCTPCTLLL